MGERRRVEVMNLYIWEEISALNGGYMPGVFMAVANSVEDARRSVETAHCIIHGNDTGISQLDRYVDRGATRVLEEITAQEPKVLALPVAFAIVGDEG